MSTIAGIVAVLILLICLFVAGVGCSKKKITPPAMVVPQAVVYVDEIELLDRTAIRSLLKRLADSPPPEIKPCSATCYVAVPPPDRVDYLCPKCGARTIYDNSSRYPDSRYDYVWFVDRKLPYCRDEFEKLQKIIGDAIEFDESEFCRECTKDTVDPRLMLHLHFSDESVRDVVIEDSSDLCFLRLFLEGELSTCEDGKEGVPLKEFLPRLEELLGVKHD